MLNKAVFFRDVYFSFRAFYLATSVVAVLNYAIAAAVFALSLANLNSYFFFLSLASLSASLFAFAFSLAFLIASLIAAYLAFSFAIPSIYLLLCSAFI